MSNSPRGSHLRSRGRLPSQLYTTAEEHTMILFAGSMPLCGRHFAFMVVHPLFDELDLAFIPRCAEAVDAIEVVNPQIILSFVSSLADHL